MKTAAHIKTNGDQPLDSEKQVNRKNVVSVEGLLNRIFPIAPLAAGLYKPQITQITQIFLFFLRVPSRVFAANFHSSSS